MKNTIKSKKKISIILITLEREQAICAITINYFSQFIVYFS